MKRLHQLAKSSIHKQFYVVIGGGHNDSWDVAGLEYYLNLKRFIDTHIAQLTKADSEDENFPSQIDQEKSASSSYVSLTGDTFSASASEGEEDGYCLVKENEVHIPTMTTNMNVR